MNPLRDKFRPTDELHWLILTCWTLGVIAITYTIAQVMA